MQTSYSASYYRGGGYTRVSTPADLRLPDRRQAAWEPGRSKGSAGDAQGGAAQRAVPTPSTMLASTLTWSRGRRSGPEVRS